MKKLVALLLVVLYSAYAFPCSTFLLSKNGHHVFGRNYDWVSGNGMVMVNARGVAKTSFMPAGGKGISWVSCYGSVTFNQFGKEFPHGGMNEKGLVIELMWLSETRYPEPDERSGVNVLQWVQYQLDNCATVEEVIATDKTIRINKEAGAPLHFLVADAAGNAAAIEFIKGRMVVQRGNDLKYPVLTNTIYKVALQQIDGSKKARGYKDNSVERFATACRMVEHYRMNTIKEQPVDYAFSILNNVSQGSYTKWSIVYDITNRQIHFVSADMQQRRQISLRDFDFTCNTTPIAFALSDRRSGDVSKYFTTLTVEQNKKLIEQSFDESAGHINIQRAARHAAAQYFQQVTCESGEGRKPQSSTQ